jgi:hypothetical protein
MAVSNNITACINFIALLCTIPVAATGLWLLSKQGEDCARLARWPSSAGFSCSSRWWASSARTGTGRACYLFAMAALITLLLGLLVFAFAVSRASGGQPVPGRGYEDYRQQGYSPPRWEGIRTCIAASGTCWKLAQDTAFIAPEQFFASHLSPIQVIHSHLP